MIKETVSLQEVIDFFNELITIDAAAVTALFNSRVKCNLPLAIHPTVQVGKIKNSDPDEYEVGIVGIINGIFGAYEDDPQKGYGAFAFNYDKTGKVTKVGITRDLVKEAKSEFKPD